MNKTVESIIQSNDSIDNKLVKLESLEDNIRIAKGFLNGKYLYCDQCKDYYLSKSFLSESEKIHAKICIYEDPINSGGNEYRDGYVKITYRVCPKGHKEEINREELAN